MFGSVDAFDISIGSYGSDNGGGGDGAAATKANRFRCDMCIDCDHTHGEICSGFGIQLGMSLVREHNVSLRYHRQSMEEYGMVWFGMCGL